MAADRQTDIHTTSANAVTLVWGSLRLAPINTTGETRPQKYRFKKHITGNVVLTHELGRELWVGKKPAIASLYHRE